MRLIWADSDFDYDRDRDFERDSRPIKLPGGRILFDVSVLKHDAAFSVHLCTRAKEVWIVSVPRLREFLMRTSDWKISYSPALKPKAPTARGYCVPCDFAKEFAHAFPLPDGACRWIERQPNKAEAGKAAEITLETMVNEDRYFPAILKRPIRKATQNEDKARGIDFWVAGETPIQVKLDAPAGFGGTGNLFFQTHTLPVTEAESWHEYTKC